MWMLTPQERRIETLAVFERMADFFEDRAGGLDEDEAAKALWPDQPA